MTIVEPDKVINAYGRISISAFEISSFQIGRGPAGESVLTLTVGENGKIRFLLPSDMPGSLTQALRKLRTDIRIESYAVIGGPILYAIKVLASSVSAQAWKVRVLNYLEKADHC